MNSKAPHNKRMQSDRPTRYASETAADARRYVIKRLTRNDKYTSN
jgi:hypothetical protein